MDTIDRGRYKDQVVRMFERQKLGKFSYPIVKEPESPLNRKELHNLSKLFIT